MKLHKIEQAHRKASLVSFRHSFRWGIYQERSRGPNLGVLDSLVFHKGLRVKRGRSLYVLFALDV